MVFGISYGLEWSLFNTQPDGKTKYWNHGTGIEPEDFRSLTFEHLYVCVYVHVFSVSILDDCIETGTFCLLYWKEKRFLGQLVRIVISDHIEITFSKRSIWRDFYS